MTMPRLPADASPGYANIGAPYVAPQSVFADSTERRKAERMRQQLMAMVSHDLRTPLTSIQGTLALLNLGALGELPAQALEKTKILETEVVRLIALTNDLLEIESLIGGRLEMTMAETKLSSILQGSAQAVETFADQHGVRIEVGQTDVSMRTDANRLLRVLVNLLANAIKFSPPGESVTVSVSKHPGSIEISVKDRGRGIPEGYHEIIFESFRQVEESDSREKGGCGLGLAICKTIVEQLGGTVAVESKAGAGSNFWLRLPL